MISVGIDISKEKSMVCILKPYGEVVVHPHEIQHTKKDMSALVSLIKSFGGEVKITMEATGAYHFPLLMILSQANLFVNVVNPLAMKKYISMSLRKGKTDKLVSIKIAQYGLDNWFHLEKYLPTEKIYDELKLLGRQYSSYIEIKIKSILSLTNLLDKTMPGIKNLLKCGSSDGIARNKLSDFVTKYWHYDNITKKSETEFVKDYCKWAKINGYHANETKAKNIYNLSKSSVTTLPSTSYTTKMLVLESVNMLNEVNKILLTILTQMQKLVTNLPEYDIVRSMPGVGNILASRLISEIGNVLRFHSGSALVAFAGIDSPPHQSGNFVGTRRKISKRGSSLLRKTGYEIIKCLKTIKPKNDAAVYEYILKKEAEGKPKKVAKIAALNKFLRI